MRKHDRSQESDNETEVEGEMIIREFAALWIAASHDSLFRRLELPMWGTNHDDGIYE